MGMILVEREETGDPMVFSVTVGDASSQSHHRVTLSERDYRRLIDRTVSPEECVRAAFAFLLAREPKESILADFDLPDIERYFPDFSTTLSRYLPQTPPNG